MNETLKRRGVGRLTLFARVENPCYLGAVLSIIILQLATQLSGQTALKVARGWGGKERTGRWNPVLVRASDATSRNVRLQLISPGPDGCATVIEQAFSIGPTPATYELLAPLHYAEWQRSVAVLRDADTGKLLGQFPKTIRGSGPEVPSVGPVQLFVGLSGRPAILEQAMRHLGGQLGFLPLQEVPRTPLGFDALDILYLNQADLRQLDAEQQRAMLDWVRGGGSLLFVPAETSVPADSVLGAVLPCRVGGVQPLMLSEKIVKQSGISPRSARLSAQALAPLSGAMPLELIKGSGITVYTKRLGLGWIMVVPIDLAAIEFEQSGEKQATLACWQPIVRTLLPAGKPPEKLKYETPYYGYQSETPQEQREGTAIATLCDFLAPPPAAGIWWRELGMIAMGVLLIVGPLDSIVLKAIGRPHLTWTTIPSWMGLLALAASFLSGWLGQKAPPAARSAGVVEQIGDVSVATTGLLAIDSSRSAELDVSQAAGWWESAVPGNADPAHARAQSDLHVHESADRCEPERITTTAQRARFLRWRDVRPLPPAIRASLLLVPMTEGPPRLTGSICNLSEHSLQRLHIRTALGVVDVPLESGRLQPQQEIKIDMSAKGQPFSTAQFEARYQNYGYFGSRSYPTALNEPEIWAVAPDLAGRQSAQIDALIESDPRVACIYGQVVDPGIPAEMTGKPPPNVEQFEWIRALVQIGE